MSRDGCVALPRGVMALFVIVVFPDHNHFFDCITGYESRHTYTQTIKLCPLDVCVCQFQMNERISFKFSHYKLYSYKNVLHIREIHLITSRAAEMQRTRVPLKSSHNINSLCDSHNPEPFEHI